MDVPPSSTGSRGCYQSVVDLVARALGQKLARLFFCLFACLLACCGRGGGAGGIRCSSRQNVVAVRGPESAAVSAAVRILPYGGEFPMQVQVIIKVSLICAAKTQ